MFGEWTLDWHRQEFYHYLAVGGAIIVALSVAVYAVPGGKFKVPGIVLSIIGSLGAGVASGVLLMGLYLHEREKKEAEANAGSENNAGGDAGRGGGGRMPMPMPGGGGGPGGRGAEGANKAQLTRLVNKLDVMTEKPLVVQLSDKQRKEVNELLDGLADLEELTDDEAKEKSEKLHKLLEDQKATLTAAGYNWPGEGRGGRGGGMGGGPMPGIARGRGDAPEPPKNPFKEKANAEHLKQLTDRLNKTQASNSQPADRPLALAGGPATGTR
jgi:hypothetical protein